MAERSRNIDEFLNKRLSERYLGQTALARAALLMVEGTAKDDLYDLEVSLEGVGAKVGYATLGGAVGGLLLLRSPAGMLLGAGVGFGSSAWHYSGNYAKAREIYGTIRTKMDQLRDEGWDIDGILAYSVDKGYAPKTKEALDEWVAGGRQTGLNPPPRRP
jgi:hypothetical protein